MKLHVEYDDFGEYVEAVIDGELVAVKDCESDRRSVELIPPQNVRATVSS